MALIGILFFLVLILLAVRFGIVKQRLENEQENNAVIHTSGIYSIVRKSPRDDFAKIKPSDEEISQYLAGQTVDSNGNILTEKIKTELLSRWKQSCERSITEIENGDSNGLEFYHYIFETDDPVCKKFIHKGNFITRQEIFKHPELIPPFHLGCTCSIKCHHETEVIKETSEIGLRPLLQDGALPSLPEWKTIVNN
jgi:hypothetical protein